MSKRLSGRLTQPICVCCQGWQIKCYEISIDAHVMELDTADAVYDLLQKEMPVASHPDAVGFAIVFHRPDNIRILANLWYGDNLSQHAFTSADGDPTRFQQVSKGIREMDMWELTVQSHEREAFIAHMKNASGPDVDAYLTDVLSVVSPHANQAAIVRRAQLEVFERFQEAWSKCDVDSLMDQMSDHPAYLTSSGPGPGLVFIGRDKVREGFDQMVKGLASGIKGTAQRPPGEAVFFGDRCLAYWSIPGTTTNGQMYEVKGVDVITFDEDCKIAIKDTYRKVWSEPAL